MKKPFEYYTLGLLLLIIGNTGDSLIYRVAFALMGCVVLIVGVLHAKREGNEE